MFSSYGTVRPTGSVNHVPESAAIPSAGMAARSQAAEREFFYMLNYHIT